MGFSNYLITKTGFLVRQFIRSFNYVAGVSGWTINKDGSAEFNNVTIRGGEVIDGTSLIYSGTPAAGNLIQSVSAVATTDQFGNTVFQGTTNIKLSAGTYYAINMGINNTLSFLTAASEAGPWTNNGGIGQGANSLSAITSAFAVTGTMSVNGAVTATGGTAASPTLITTDTWHTISLDAGWTAGSPAPSCRLLPDGRLELTGMATHTAFTTETALNSGMPIPALYRPATNKNYQANRAGGTSGAQIKTTGVIFAEPNGVSNTSVDLTGTLPLNL